MVGCDSHVDSVYLGNAEADLLEAVSRGDLKVVQEFLDNGGNVNLQDEPGMTPLHHAASSDSDGSNLAMVQLLIDKGANANAIDDTHHTPLHMVSCKATAEALIDAGANVNAKTLSEGETIIFSAAWGAAQGHPKSHQRYFDLTKMLIEKGADVSVKLKAGSGATPSQPYHDKAGDTVLHKVARSYSEKDAIGVCELLITNGASVNETNSIGNTPLDEAILNQRNDTASFLREHGGKSGSEL